MKKQYIQPTIEVIEMNYVFPLMAGSALGVGDGMLNADDALSPEMDNLPSGMDLDLQGFLFE